jgi:hypothetical protein
MGFGIEETMKQYDELKQKRYAIDSQMRDREMSMCDYILDSTVLSKAIAMGLLKTNFRMPAYFLEAVKNKIKEIEKDER